MSDVDGFASPEYRAQSIYAAHGFVALANFLGDEMVSYLSSYVGILRSGGQMSAEMSGLATGSQHRYGDKALDAVLLSKAPLISEIVGASLLPTYSYIRTYLMGQSLAPHTDRHACEHSISVCIAAASQALWPLHVRTRRGEIASVKMTPGDAVLYRGIDLPHWREPLVGAWHTQLFLHYVSAEGQFRNEALDRRQRLGESRPASEASSI